MIAKVSVKGQTVIPEAIHEMAGIKAGDQLDVGYSGGLIIMCKCPVDCLCPVRPV